MQEFHDIWEPVLKALSEQFTSTIMNLWFNPLELAAFSDTTAVIIAESNIKKKIIINRYKETLEQTFESALGFPVEVCILSDETAVIDRAQLQHDVGMGMTGEVLCAKYAAENDAPAETTVDTSSASPTANTPKTAETAAPQTNREAAPASAESRTAQEQNAHLSLSQTEPFQNSDYTFDNFIVGSSNKFAHAACIAVANSPAIAYNPLFIHGPSGLGKTHLLYAITNRIRENKPDANIVYVKGETFTNQLIESLSISPQYMAQFRAKYRQADVFLIDDVQFIAGKTSTQEEFFNTFNELYEAKKQIILTSDRPPKEIKTLEDRLKSRFEWGLIADIQPPDLELRIAILRKKALDMGVEVPIDVLNFLGENLRSNIRQLEGVIRRLGAYSNLAKRPITIDMARENIADVISGAEPVKVTQDKILNAVARKYGVTIEDIRGKRRTREIAQARHVSIYIMRNVTDLSLPSLGRVFNRDHTTILSSVETIQAKIREDASLENDIDDLIKEITNQ
ncbi:MAG: chromosomal replication initiator protein DnaA [Clostridia bacterium]|nr:chromosomal replication initiator protein DnaA [Clostridia bacterium]